MDVYLEHHRSFCENLARLNMLPVSWDEKGGLPLRKKALQAAIEIFGRRPDLTIGSVVDLKRGGLKIGLIRDGRDITLLICAQGTVSLSRHLPRTRPDIELFAKAVEEPLFETLTRAVPLFTGPRLDRGRKEDHPFTEPFEGFELLRLFRRDDPRERRILVGRRTHSEGIFAFHDARDLPTDIFRDQILCGTTRLSDLLTAYQETSASDPEPV
ncbi:hypothetical protein IQ03_03907 [Gemmobacter caeni]|uniref:Uncharacterized protein n=1 Tax=Gemmobacter caeni TaxID=589035 RepID=A0A2T6B986_9RHOB|nr:hypothetical protein [Gemmobacter caeni]PTX52637.1 hypothetical protein C8N34_102455 [Gemmobacter caeni]TWI94908.1 hypothetical protein IQ03_03907 [Gemmobacter caeni]